MGAVWRVRGWDLAGDGGRGRRKGAGGIGGSKGGLAGAGVGSGRGPVVSDE